MRSTFPLLFLKRRTLDDLKDAETGQPVTWSNGEPISTVSAFDIDTEQTVSLTIDPDFVGDMPEVSGSMFDGLVRITSRDGKVKYRLLAIV
jgi:hypothetical protein